MKMDDSKQVISLIRNPLFLFFTIILLFILMSLVGSMLQRHKTMEIKHTVEALDAISMATKDTLETFWFNDMVSDLNMDLDSPEIHSNVLKLIKSDTSHEKLIHHPSQIKLAETFRRVHTHRNIKGIFLMNRDYVSLASLDNHDIGRRSFIVNHYPQRLEGVFAGEAQFIPPIPSDHPRGNKPAASPVIFILIPVFDTDKKVIAAFGIRLDPSDSFSKIAENGQLGKTGETYFIDHKGTILTKSRFRNQTLESGLKMETDEISMLEARDTGINLTNQREKRQQSNMGPLTYGVRACIGGDSEPYYNSYRDYRGVNVYGSWHWSNRLGVGVITEIDKEEALHPYYAMRTMIIVETLFAMFMLGLFIYSIYIISKKSFMKLQERSSYLNTVIDNSLNAMVTINRYGTVTAYNRVAEKLFGYKAEEVIGNNVNMLVPEPHKSLHDTYIQNYLQTGIKKIIGSTRQIEALRKDGTKILIELGLSEAVYDNEIFFIASIHDYTDRIAYEDELKTHQMVLKEAQRIGKMGYWRWFINNDTIFCSQTMYNIFGMEHSDVPIPFNQIMSGAHPDDAEHVKQSLEAAIETKSNVQNIYGRVVRPDGTIRYVVSSAEVILDEDGNVVEMLGTMMDITEQHQEREEIELLYYALDQIKEAVYLIDEHSLIHYANHGSQEQIGYASGELNGTSVLNFTVDMSLNEWSFYWNDLQKRKTIIRETQHRHKNGSLIDVEISANIITYNEQVYMLKMVRNITERKKNEFNISVQQKELERLNLELSKQVDISESKLIQNEKIMIVQSRQAAMGEMISMIAHQWRQPLAAIAATAINMKIDIEFDSVQLDDTQSRDEYIKKSLTSLSQIEFFVKNLTQTIDDFRNFYKPDKEASKTSISGPIKKTIKIIKTAFEASGINVEFSLQSHNQVNIHENEIVQVLLNILKNSEDNFKEKGIENGVISIVASDFTDGISIEICDNGGGIPEEILPHIFEPYYSTKNDKNGTGLGLYMSKIIIEEHHKGKIEAKNNHHGVCFLITIKE